MFHTRLSLYPQMRLLRLKRTSAWTLPKLNFCLLSQYPWPPFPGTSTPSSWIPICVAPRACRPLYISCTPMPGVNHLPTATSSAGAMRSPNLHCLSWSPKKICPPAPTRTNQLLRKRFVSTRYLSLLYSTFSSVVTFCAKALLKAMAQSEENRMNFFILIYRATARTPYIIYHVRRRLHQGLLWFVVFFMGFTPSRCHHLLAVHHIYVSGNHACHTHTLQVVYHVVRAFCLYSLQAGDFAVDDDAECGGGRRR